MQIPITWNGEVSTLIRQSATGPKVEIQPGETVTCELSLARSYAKNDKRFYLNGVPLAEDEESLKKRINELEKENETLKARINELDPKPDDKKTDKEKEKNGAKTPKPDHKK